MILYKKKTWYERITQTFNITEQKFLIIIGLTDELQALTRMETWLLGVEQTLYEYPLSKGEVGEMKTLMERLKVFIVICLILLKRLVL